MFDQQFLEQIKERLMQEKAEVEKKITDLTKPEVAQDNPNADDLAQEAADDILEDSLHSVYKNIQERIDAALGRLQDGTFGRCVECGKEISRDDLLKEPWVEHCRDCKK